MRNASPMRGVISLLLSVAVFIRGVRKVRSPHSGYAPPLGRCLLSVRTSASAVWALPFLPPYPSPRRGEPHHPPFPCGVKLHHLCGLTSSPHPDHHPYIVRFVHTPCGTRQYRGWLLKALRAFRNHPRRFCPALRAVLLKKSLTLQLRMNSRWETLNPLKIYNSFVQPQLTI